jgi:hydrogenase maturation factor
MDPWRATTSGTLLLSVDPAAIDGVLEAIRDRRTPVAQVGRVVGGQVVGRRWDDG